MYLSLNPPSSLPFPPSLPVGADPLPAAPLAGSTRAAAAEADSGLWLMQLEAAQAAAGGGGGGGGGDGSSPLLLPRVAAPGLQEGLCGGWAAPDDLVPPGESWEEPG